MNTAHTPGPWNCDKPMHGDTHRYVHVDGPVICVINLAGDRLLAEANAMLIAAAPELLEALKDAYPHVADDVLRDRIGAVIAKATGVTA